MEILKEMGTLDHFTCLLRDLYVFPKIPSSMTAKYHKTLFTILPYSPLSKMLYNLNVAQAEMKAGKSEEIWSREEQAFSKEQ